MSLNFLGLLSCNGAACAAVKNTGRKVRFKEAEKLGAGNCPFFLLLYSPTGALSLCD